MERRLSPTIVRGVVLLVQASFAFAAAAACGAPQPPPGLPTVQSPAPGRGASPSSGAQVSNYEKALRFTRCMNENGRRDRNGDIIGGKLPDPVEGEPLLKSSSTGGGFEKCKHLLPDAWPVKADPDDLARFGRLYDCMRERGIDIPKPDAQGMINANPNPDHRYTPEYQAAEQACRHLADDPAAKVDS